MIKSMTAFARTERTEAGLTVSTEIRSYNSRHLDLALRIPGEYLLLEEKLKGLISSAVSRGRVEMTVKIRDEKQEAVAFEVNEPVAKAYYHALVRLTELLGMEPKITVDQLAGVSGIVKPCQIEIDPEACWPLVRACVQTVLQDLDAMRQREGDHLAQDLSRRLDGIERLLGHVESESSGLLQMYQERLRERISALTNGLTEIDSARIAQEAAFLADRSDISEEIVRAKSHVRQFRSIMTAEEPAGRKLNFLLQEFNREFNTMGSKAANESVSHAIVEVKSELEKMREQVQNIE